MGYPPFPDPHPVLRTSDKCCKSCRDAKDKWESGWSSRSMRSKPGGLVGLCFLASLLLSPLTNGQEQWPQARGVLRERLTKIAASFPGKVGIFVLNIETGAEAGVNADDQFPMASTYKVAIMVQVFREAEAGRLSLTQRVTLGPSDRRLGSGLFPYMDTGLAPTIHDLILLMITVSDNEATDLLLKMVGAKNVTALLRRLDIDGMRVDR